MTTQDPELSAALGWPGGISDPVLDRKVLLQMVAALRLASQQALGALEDARTFTGAWPTGVSAITAFRAALAQQDEPVEVAERERVASQWDGCVTHQLDTFGPVDIGASIRAGELVEAQQAEPAHDRHGACPTHCCPVHGCKYMHDDCPVAAGAVQPVYPRNNGCESCADDALAQQAEPDHETRAELAEQQVVQLAEERDHYRNLWQKAQQDEPAQDSGFWGRVAARQASRIKQLETAAQQALEALEWHYRQGHSNTLGGFRLKIDEKALRELRAAMAQQDEPVEPVEPVAKVIATAPKRIWLDLGFEPADEDITFDQLFEVTWSQDNATGWGIEYVRADLVAPPQRTMVPLTEEEILAAVGWERAAMYMKLTPNFPVDEAKKETLTNARAVEKASWEKNHGQA